MAHTASAAVVEGAAPSTVSSSMSAVGTGVGSWGTRGGGARTNTLAAPMRQMWVGTLVGRAASA